MERGQLIGIWSHVREPESCRIPAVVILYRLEQERPGLLQGTLLLYGRIPRAGDWRRCEMDGPSALHGRRIPGVAVWGGGTAPEGEHRRQRQEHRRCGQSGFFGAASPFPSRATRCWMACLPSAMADTISPTLPR